MRQFLCKLYCIVFVISVICLVNFWTVAATETRTVTDQIGRTVTVPVQPKRIVALIPSLTEIVYELGKGDLLVGATQFAKEPPSAANLPRVGSYLHLDIERIVALQPDLCLAVKDGNPEHLVKRIEQLGIPVFAFDSQKFDDIAKSIQVMGALLGASKRAEEIVGTMQKKIDRVTARNKAMLSRPAVFFQIDANPIVSAGKGTFIDQMITMAGGKNLASGQATYPRYSWEDILALQPEVVIIASMAGGYSKKELRDAWLKWPQIPAVKTGRVHVVDANLFDRPVPRLADGLLALAELIQPDDIK